MSNDEYVQRIIIQRDKMEEERARAKDVLEKFKALAAEELDCAKQEAEKKVREVKNALSDAQKLMQQHRESWNDWAREGPQQIKEALLGAAGNKDKIFQDIIAQLEEGYVLKFRDEVEKRNREK